MDRVAETMNAADDPHAVRQWYPWSIVREDPGLDGAVWGALRVLEQHALIWHRGETHTPGGSMEPEYQISPYGDYFIEMLAAPVPE
jgi:hypothetical protein